MVTCDVNQIFLKIRTIWANKWSLVGCTENNRNSKSIHSVSILGSFSVLLRIFGLKITKELPNNCPLVGIYHVTISIFNR